MLVLIPSIFLRKNMELTLIKIFLRLRKNNGNEKSSKIFLLNCIFFTSSELFEMKRFNNLKPMKLRLLMLYLSISTINPSI